MQNVLGVVEPHNPKMSKVILHCHPLSPMLFLHSGTAGLSECQMTIEANFLNFDELIHHLT